MKKALIAVLLVIITALIAGCVSNRGPMTMFVGSFGQINKASDKVIFITGPSSELIFDRPLKDDKIPDVIDKDFYGYEGPWKYVSTFNLDGYNTRRVNVYNGPVKENKNMVAIVDDNGKCILLNDPYLNTYPQKDIETPDGAEAVTEEAAVEIAKDFAVNVLQLSVEGYSISCVPVHDTKGRLNYYELNFDAGYHGEYAVKDNFSINVDGYKGRYPFNIRTFNTLLYKSIGDNDIPEIDVKKMDDIISSNIFSEVKKEIKETYPELKLNILEREIIADVEGKLCYKCEAEVSKLSNELENDEKIWTLVYSAECYIPLD